MKSSTFLVAILLIPACGGSGNHPLQATDDAAADEDAATADVGAPSKGGADATTVASGCDQAAALCTKLQECAPFYLKAVYGDATACADRLTKVCTEQSFAAGNGMTGDNILACKNSLAAATCKNVFANNLPLCAFRGTLSDGTKCGDHSQCASGFCSLGGAQCGVCTGKGAAGAACPSGTNDECQSNLVCSQGKLCVAPAEVGGACDDTTEPCLTGSFCTTAKTCALTVAAGQDCPGAYLNVGDGTLCWGKGTAASPQTSTQLGTATAGQPCGLTPGTGLPPTLCAPGSVAACSLKSGGIQLFGIPTLGICTAPIQDGYTCTATDICLPGAQCIGGTCQIPSGRGC